MGISHYLAMTAEEIAGADALPENLAYMACHLSPYGTGLTGFPEILPEKTMLILNDRIPFCGHDEILIGQQLTDWMGALHCSCLLLDFQRESTPKSLANHLVQSLSFPIGITADFSVGTDCPVFLPPVPPDTPLKDYLKPWTGREVWLETSREILRITLDTQGSSKKHLPFEGSGSWPFSEESLHCHYRTQVFPDRVEFFLTRTQEDQKALLKEAESMGVTTSVSLYQEMKKLPVR